MPRNIQRNIQVYLQQAPYNIEFTLKKACGDGDWNRLSHGERKSYGKKFLRMVMNEEFACVATRKVSGTQRYLPGRTGMSHRRR